MLTTGHMLKHRRFSSSSPRFPYPEHPNPTPHQIFHLPRSATSNEIKDRCTSLLFFLVEISSEFIMLQTDYDLVKTHHPDRSKLPTPLAQQRFHAITSAYATLCREDAYDSGKPLRRRRRSDTHPGGWGQDVDMEAFAARQRRRFAEENERGAGPLGPVEHWAAWAMGVFGIFVSLSHFYIILRDLF